MMMYNENCYYQQQQEELSQSNAFVDAAHPFSYNEPIGKGQQQQQQEDWNMMELEEEANEEECYAQYDLDMANALAEADYQDYYYEQQHQDYYNEQYEEEEEECEEEDYYYQTQEQQQTSYEYQNDSLLSLVVGVQSYLTEQQADYNKNSTKLDSPLYNLQYKMYTYMRQRALELGVQL